MFSRLVDLGLIRTLTTTKPVPEATLSRKRIATATTRLVYRVFLCHGPDAVGRIGMMGHFFTSRNGNVVTFKYHTMGPYYNASIEVAALAHDMARIMADAQESVLFQTFSRTPIRSLPFVSPGLRDTQHKVEITAMDHPGMVQEVGELTARYGLNISYAHGVLYPEPLSDRAYFGMKLLIDVPERSSDRLADYATSLERLEPKHGFKVYGPVPDREIALFTTINWTESRQIP